MLSIRVLGLLLLAAVLPACGPSGAAATIVEKEPGQEGECLIEIMAPTIPGLKDGSDCRSPEVRVFSTPDVVLSKNIEASIYSGHPEPYAEGDAVPTPPPGRYYVRAPHPCGQIQNIRVLGCGGE
jgi:hypothetical protein